MVVLRESDHVIKPIETRYKGYRFRSRLEARWAVFFDALGIEWEYEPEGYDLGDAGWYLPDFWLKNIGLRGQEPGIWAEIKPEAPTETEENKLEKLVIGTKTDGVILIGAPQANAQDHLLDGHYQYAYEPQNEGCCWWDNCMTFMKCYSCGAMKIEFLEGNYMYCHKCGSDCDKWHPMIEKATIKARSARFEFGESV